MDWKKIAPWNWFKDEEAQTKSGRQLPSTIDAPGDPLASFRSQFDRLFEDTVRHWNEDLPQRRLSAAGMDLPLRPNVDISEGKKAYTIRAELPGVEFDDLSLEVEGHTLSLRAEKRQDLEEEDEGYHWVERSYGAVQRVLSLPDDADVDAIDAHFKNGVLKLSIPKHAVRASTAQTIKISQ